MKARSWDEVPTRDANRLDASAFDHSRKTEAA
jgi:hypothetical protein